MSIITFDAANREAIIQQHAQGESILPDGVQMRMEVVDLSKNRVYRIFEVTDPKAILEANLAWNDLARIETFPVMETDEVLETLDRIRRRTGGAAELESSLELASLM
jgi:hypothetical protein